MKFMISTEKAVPVPARVRVIAVLACSLLLCISIAVGAALAPEGDIPVALADGEVITPPWYITVDGEAAVLVESREAAEKVMDSVIEEFDDEPESILDIQIAEDTGIKRMELQNGDEPPDILTEREAKKELLSGNEGEGYLTVVVTREKSAIETIGCEEEYKPEPDMYVGETRVEDEGQDGAQKVTKKIVSENGKTVDENVVEVETIREPSNRVVLTGTRNYDGFGGSSDAVDAGVSYKDDATYTTLAIPVEEVHVTSRFGPRWGGFHHGLDLGAPMGSDIYAADSGTVYHAGYSGGYGNLIKIDHGNGMQTYYAHCSSLLAAEGQKVERGQRIALIGSTGNSTGPHLHFEVIVNGSRIDPMDILGIE